MPFYRNKVSGLTGCRVHLRQQPQAWTTADLQRTSHCLKPRIRSSPAFLRPIPAANSGPHLFHLKRTVSWPSSEILLTRPMTKLGVAAGRFTWVKAGNNIAITLRDVVQPSVLPPSSKSKKDRNLITGERDIGNGKRRLCHGQRPLRIKHGQRTFPAGAV